MFGNSSGIGPPPCDSSLPTTSSSSSASNTFLIHHHLPPSSSSSASSSSASSSDAFAASAPLLMPSTSSVIVPTAHHPQLGQSPSMPIETAPFFGTMMSNIIATLATSLSRQQSFLASQQQQQQSQSNNNSNHMLELFQHGLAERLRQGSSTPSSAMAELSFRNTMDNSSANHNNGTATMQHHHPLQNGCLGNFHHNLEQHNNLPQQQFHNQHHQQLGPVQSVPAVGMQQKSLSTAELLRALQTVAVANQQQQQQCKLLGNSMLLPQQQQMAQMPQANGTIGAVPQQQNNGTMTTALLEQQLLAVIALQQQCNTTNNNSNNGMIKAFPASTMPTFASCTGAGCGGTTTETNNNNSKVAEAVAQPPQLPPQPPVLAATASADNLLPAAIAARKCDIRRSASSVSYKCSANVHEHFQRTFSGKWPRRSMRAHLPASGGRGNAEAESVKEEAMEEEDGGGSGKAPEGKVPPPPPEVKTRPRQQVKNMYSAVIRKLFTNNEVKQVEDHFRKSLGDDRFQQIKNEQQRKAKEAKPDMDMARC